MQYESEEHYDYEMNQQAMEDEGHAMEEANALAAAEETNRETAKEPGIMASEPHIRRGDDTAVNDKYFELRRYAESGIRGESLNMLLDQRREAARIGLSNDASFPEAVKLTEFCNIQILTALGIPKEYLK